MDRDLAALLLKVSRELASRELSESRRHACIALLDAVVILANATDAETLRESFHCARAAATATRFALHDESQ
ncbi:MAG: hypothetical protein HOV71_19965 [Hamadaea sp.]|uniref:hypothetical protein n=1 Tax=Hamadaea sp. NPDC050747 TaxID=3155789 RepID=UPI0017D2100A|nr:hypothetical protein [Hamadaea sp.]NUR50408.1 hypothetical protein [Hamadaea sp.]NUT03680.1 hypothetical protein [Hamadaea sp.]